MEFNGLKEYKEKLEKANSIIQRIAEANKNITPITHDDYDLFAKFFDNEERHT